MDASPTIANTLGDSNRVGNCSRLVQTLAVGPWHEREFSVAKSEIAEATTWQSAKDLAAASKLLADCDVPPELILLAQPLPGETSQSEIDRLQLLAPLTRIVVVAGTWCEGEMRTGTHLAGTLRLYWYEFAPWWHAATKRLKAGMCPPWSFPLDHPQAGRHVRNFNIDEAAPSGRVAIDAGDHAVFESLAAGLAARGIGAFWTRQRGQNDLAIDGIAGIWDGGQLSQRELNRLAGFCRQVHSRGGRVVALLDFPRVEHFAQAHAAGAATVFGKPYDIDALFAALLVSPLL